MKVAIRAARALSLLILALLIACDNVNWGGADLTVVRPPPKAAPPPENDTTPVVTSSDEPLPTGPVVYYVARAGDRGVMVPVGEVESDSLRPLRPRADARVFSERYVAEHMRQGSEFVLFHNGSRVGTLVVQSAAQAEGQPCLALPRATGSLELSAAASGVNEFLALSQLHAPQVPRRAEQRFDVTRTMTFVAPILAERMLRKRGAPMPGSWQGAMEQAKPFPVSTGQEPGFSATFLVGDTLGPGLDDQGYALLFLAVPSSAEVGWDTVFVNFRDYPTAGGKAAPRLVDFLDWDRDDHAELLYQVYDVNGSWFEAVGRGNRGAWRKIMSDQCEGTAGTRIPRPTTQRDTTSSGRGGAPRP
jgi:hypothetical protein